MRTLPVVLLALVAFACGGPGPEELDAGLAESTSELRVTGFKTVDRGVVFRSARPTAAQLASFKRQGGKAILNLEEDAAAIAFDRAEARRLGLKFISKPMSAWNKPTDAKVNAILDVVNDRANYPLLIHCRHGQDRTGLIVGLHRVEDQGDDAADAYEEMLDHGFHTNLVHLDRYFKKRTGMIR